MTEFDLIRKLTQSLETTPEVVEGPGDDCAVLEAGCAGEFLLFKTDAVVEGVHFLGSADPVLVGRKAMARALSDVAAMSGWPVAALVTIGLPENFDPEWVAKAYEGMNDLARSHRFAIVGGETTSNPGRMLISVSLLGRVEQDRCVRRRGARVGDALFVTGELGGSMAGRHLTFEPRLREARWLTEHFTISSMIDLSDGLAGDLRHIATASGVGAELLESALPYSSAARFAAKYEGGKPAPLAALVDGEDYELLFTVAPGDAVPLLDGWNAQFPETRLSCIGKITEGSACVLRGATGMKSLPTHGYVHFEKRR